MADSNGYKETLSKPISIILLGRAGSGRSNLLASITELLNSKAKNTFNINLDPLIESERLYDISISDSAPYESIKLHYNFTNTKTLLTSLNIFTTKFDQLKKILSEKESTFEYLFVDTPNPDDFLHSPPGITIPKILASEYPTVVLYVVDCQKCQDPLVLMRTFVDACSVKMKFDLPVIIVCNKNDLVDWSILRSWMDDSSLLMEALLDKEFDVSNDIAAKIYDFPRLCEELKIVTTSVKNCNGLEELVKAIDESRIEYETSYKSNHKDVERMVGIMKKQVASLNDGPILHELLSIPIRISYPGEHDITSDDVDESQVEDCIERNLLLIQSKLRGNNESVEAANDDDDDYENIVKEHFSLG